MEKELKLNDLKVITDYSRPTVSKIILNGQDISNMVSDVTIKIEGGNIPMAVIGFPLDTMEIETQADIKVKSREKVVKE